MRSERRHGQVATQGDFSGCRWCWRCRQFHSYLYACEHYNRDILSEIAELQVLNQSNWGDSEYIQKQLDDGMPAEGVVIMQMFAGLKNKKTLEDKVATVEYSTLQCQGMIAENIAALYAGTPGDW